MSPEEIHNTRKDKFLKIGRRKGFVTQPEDLSSLKSSNNLNQLLKTRKNQIGIFVSILSLLIFLFVFL